MNLMNRETFKFMLNSYADGERVSSDDAVLLTALLALHDEAKNKIGNGIDHFKVRRTRPWNTLCFYVVRIDATEADFSYIHCFTPKRQHPALAGLRLVIAEDMATIKRQAFNGAPTIVCPLTNAVITPKQAHVDHTNPPFSQLVKDFLVLHDLTLDNIHIEPPTDNQTETRLADADLIHRFRDYHTQHATLRVIAASANMAKGNR